VEARSPAGISARGGRQLTHGADMSMRGKRDQGYQFGFELGGPQAVSSSGPKGSPRGPSLFFPFIFLLFFCFLYFFISFSNLIQIDSNQNANFSKIQLNILRQ
jgi:hypothetical protein